MWLADMLINQLTNVAMYQLQNAFYKMTNSLMNLKLLNL